MLFNVSCLDKAGGGIYDLKITAELLYDVTGDIITYDNGLTKVNPYSGVICDYVNNNFC